MRHEEIESDLIRRLKREFLYVSNNENFFIQGVNGEIDVYAVDFNKRKIFAIEVKQHLTQRSESKLCVQLEKDKLFLKNDFPKFKIYLMFAYSEHTKRGYTVSNYK